MNDFIFTIDMLPAGRGDCLWIEYGNSALTWHILIDGGTPETHAAIRDRITTLPPHRREIELLIISHIDLDHIGGILELLRDPPEDLKIRDVWFNGWDQLLAVSNQIQKLAILGPKQGEIVSYYLKQLKLNHNDAFNGGPVFRPAGKPLPKIALPGGMDITILGPTPERLQRLLPEWKRIIEDLGLDPGTAGALLAKSKEDKNADGILGDTTIDALLAAKFERDVSRANGSSIALLLEYNKRRLICTGDAFAEDIVEAVHMLTASSGLPNLPVTGMKLSHHGGKKNTSAALFRKLRCRNWLISTDGTYYGHPDEETIASVIRLGRSAGDPRLFFNYNTTENTRWRAAALRREEQYDVISPQSSDIGLKVDLTRI